MSTSRRCQRSSLDAVRARSARTPNRDGWVIWLCVGGARARSARAQAAVAPPWLMLRGDGGKCVRARSARTPIRAGASMWQRVGARARAERARLACVTWHMTWHSGLQVGWPNGRAPAPQRESGATGVWLGVVLCVWQLARCVWVGMAARSAAKTILDTQGPPKQQFWIHRVSIPVPLACEASALPFELCTLAVFGVFASVPDREIAIYQNNHHFGTPLIHT